MADSRLSEKTAIITGGGSGIGRAICQLFAKKGARAAVLDIDAKTAYETLDMLHISDGVVHCAIEADVTKADDVKRAFRIAEEKIGNKCNILINNAGLGTNKCHFGELEENNFDFVINVNLKGNFLMAKEFVNSLKDLDEVVRGSMINISSLAGKTGFAGRAHYAASKAGVIGLTKSIALEFQTHRIRCNALLPGLTETNPVKSAKELRNEFLQKIPLRRFAEPEEIANGCLFLASDESSYVHGACLEIGGGLEA